MKANICVAGSCKKIWGGGFSTVVIRLGLPVFGNKIMGNNIESFKIMHFKVGRDKYYSLFQPKGMKNGSSV